MPARAVLKARKKKVSFARLAPAVRNRIIGMKMAGAVRGDMRDKCRKTDGTKPSLRAVDVVLANFEEDPEWDGRDSSAGGRPRLLTSKEEKSIKRILERDVGKFVVTARYVKKKLKAVRKVKDRVVVETFARLGYSYGDRRRKAAIAEKYKPDRLVYCDWLRNGVPNGDRRTVEDKARCCIRSSPFRLKGLRGDGHGWG